MYRKDNDGWLKHIDFIMLDLICLQLAYVLAFAISGYGFNPYASILYRNTAIFIEFVDILVLLMSNTLKGVLKRGHYVEFMITLKHCLIVGGISILYLFLLQEGQNYSRLALILLVVIYTGLTYLVRELWKRNLQKKMIDGSEKSLLIVASSDIAERVVRNMKANNYARYKIAGVAVIDRDWVGSVVGGVEVVADMDSAAMYVCREWVDEVLIVTSGSVPYPHELIEQFTETGVTVHLSLAKVTNVPGKKQFVEKIGNYTVLTTSMNYASGKQLFAKRVIDIMVGLAGCILTGIIFIFVAPVIYISSPGPIFFSQERVRKEW